MYFLIDRLKEVALKRNIDFSSFSGCAGLVLWTIKLDGRSSNFLSWKVSAVTTDCYIVAKPKILPLHSNICSVTMVTNFNCFDGWFEIKYNWWNEFLWTGKFVVWHLLQKPTKKPLLDIYKWQMLGKSLDNNYY